MIQRYSSWYKLKRGFAWLIRFKEFIKNKLYSRRGLSNPSGARLLPKELSLEDIRTAEVELIKYVQRESFPQVLDTQKRSEAWFCRSYTEMFRLEWLNLQVEALAG